MWFRALSTSLSYCLGQFGIERAVSRAAIVANEAKWTRLVANATRILWVNGDLDPLA